MTCNSLCDNCESTLGWLLLAVITLALGVGANTGIFTVIESVLLRPLPYANSNRLVYIGGGDPGSFTSTSWLNYQDIKTQSTLLQSVAGYSEDVSVLQAKDNSQSLSAPHVTPNVFPMLGVQPLVGRTFTEAEGQPGGPLAALLSDGLWRQTFHGDQGVIGQSVRIGGKPYTIVGVMPQSFRFPEELGPDQQKGVWVPLQPTTEMLKNRGYNMFNVIAELRPGVTVAQAQHELDAITSRMHRDKDDLPITSVREFLPRTADRAGPSGSDRAVWCTGIGFADRVRQRVKFVDRALFGSAAGVCRPHCLGSWANTSRAADARGRAGSQSSWVWCGLGLAQLAIVGVHKLPQGPSHWAMRLPFIGTWCWSWQRLPSSRLCCHRCCPR